MCATGWLTPGDRASVLLDFERSFHHILYVLQLKTAHWQTNPWKLLALGHHDVDVARTHCRLGYSMFQQLTPEEQLKEHRMTIALCSEDGTLHQEFMRFINRESVFNGD